VIQLKKMLYILLFFYHGAITSNMNDYQITYRKSWKKSCIKSIGPTFFK